jgi:hypothetical protein
MIVPPNNLEGVLHEVLPGTTAVRRYKDRNEDVNEERERK